MGKGGAARPVVAAETSRDREAVAAIEQAHGPTRLLLLRAEGAAKAGAEGPTREKEGGWVTNNYGQISQISINKQRWLSETGKNLFSSQYKCHKQVNKMDFSEMKMFEQHHNPTQILFHTIGDKKGKAL